MDIKHSYIEKGDGKCLILLHGNGESKEYFEKQIDYFSNFRRVIAVDTRGHGETPRGVKQMSLAVFADDLADFFERMSIDKADILGFSDGANIAIMFAAQNPAKVDRLILNGGNTCPSGVKGKYQIPIVLTYAFLTLCALLDKRCVAKRDLFGLMVKEPHFTKEYLSKIQSKTLVIAGEDDMIKESDTKKLHSLLNDSQLCIIKGDHFIASKNPDEFNAKVKEFLCK